LRKTEGKCRGIIRDIENLRLTLGDDAQAKESIDKQGLSNKKKQVEMLMKI
jgi:hypothetical protein